MTLMKSDKSKQCEPSAVTLKTNRWPFVWLAVLFYASEFEDTVS